MMACCTGVLFYNSCQGPADTDAIGAHVKRLFPSLPGRKEGTGMEGFGVFGIEFEDLPHFNASGFFQMPFAVRALVPFMGRADVKDLV